MQSLYWVLTWACHRKCKHCYDDRFRPYVRDALSEVVGEGVASYENIIENLPDDLSWHNDETGARISIQTTGDILTAEILDECIARGVSSIAIASIDDYHVGMTGERKFKFMEKIRALMASRGVKEVSLGGENDERLKAPDLDEKISETDLTFLFFGAQPDLWIGELWPRGRAFTNGLCAASYETNFCARWSGGKDFLKIGQAGSEVSIEPNGNIYPCCLKTKKPLGNLTEEPLANILESVAKLPAIQALNRGEPEQMGLESGWDPITFRKKSAQADGKGNIVENKCLGCDAYFEEKLGTQLADLRAERLAAFHSR